MRTGVRAARERPGIGHGTFRLQRVRLSFT